MKRCLCLFLFVFMVAGCSRDVDMQSMTDLRNTLLKMNSCSFDARITADYGEIYYTFFVSCEADREGNVTFLVKEPQSIAGVGGKIQNENGKLTYEDVVLGFPLLADGEISPVSAPWIVIRSLLSGYIHSCGKEQGYTHVVDRKSVV